MVAFFYLRSLLLLAVRFCGCAALSSLFLQQYWTTKQLETLFTSKEVLLSPTTAFRLASDLVYKNDIDSMAKFQSRGSERNFFSQKTLTYLKQQDIERLHSLLKTKGPLQQPSFIDILMGFPIANWLALVFVIVWGLTLITVGSAKTSTKKNADAKKDILIVNVVEDKETMKSSTTTSSHTNTSNMHRPLIREDTTVQSVAIPVPSPVESMQTLPDTHTPSTSNSNEPMLPPPQVVVLMSSMSWDAQTNRMIDLFSAKKILVEKVDGAAPEEKELRDRLFILSEKRGKYPQCFLKRDNDDAPRYEFIGTWEQIQDLLESESIAKEFLSLHPEIQTFSKVKFSCVASLVLVCFVLIGIPPPPPPPHHLILFSSFFPGKLSSPSRSLGMRYVARIASYSKCTI